MCEYNVKIQAREKNDVSKCIIGQTQINRSKIYDENVDFDLHTIFSSDIFLGKKTYYVRSLCLLKNENLFVCFKWNSNFFEIT